MAEQDGPPVASGNVEADSLYVQRVELQLRKKEAETALKAVKDKIKALDEQVIDDLAAQGARSVKLDYGPNIHTKEKHALSVLKADWPQVEAVTGQALEVLDLLALEVTPGQPGDPTEAIKEGLLAISAAWNVPVIELQDTARVIAELGSLGSWTVNYNTMKAWWKEVRQAAAESETDADADADETEKPGPLPAPLAPYMKIIDELEVGVTNPKPFPTAAS